MQRGLIDEEATALIVNGFVKDVLQQLPMEFAVEAQKLIAISLEGSVGELTCDAAASNSAGERRRRIALSRSTRPNDPTTPRAPALNLTERTCSKSEPPRRIDDKTILKGSPDRERRRGRRHHGAERLRQVDAVLCHRRQATDYEVTEGEVLLDGENLLEMEPDERAAEGVFLAFQYPMEIPGVATMTFLKAALNAQRKARGEAELSTPDFIAPRASAAAEQLEYRQEMLKRAAQCRLLRRREEAHGDPADGAAGAAASACSTRPIPASTSMRCGSSPKASTRCARQDRAFLVITHYQRLLEPHRAGHACT